MSATRQFMIFGRFRPKWSPRGEITMVAWELRAKTCCQICVHVIGCILQRIC